MTLFVLFFITSVTLFQFFIKRTIAAIKAQEILKNSQTVIAMEIFVACQALDLQPKKHLGKLTCKVYGKVRQDVDFISEDTVMYQLIEKCRKMVEKGDLCD